MENGDRISQFRIAQNYFAKSVLASLSDTDAAHRVKSSRTSISPPSGFCKFTRRLVKEQVMKSRKEVQKNNISESTVQAGQK